MSGDEPVPGPKIMFWDAYVLARWLTTTPSTYVDHIDQYIQEASRGQRKIIISTISFAEIRPRFLKMKKYGTVVDLVNDFKSAFYPISPTPDIMIRAGLLKDLEFKKSTGTRVVGTGDAIQLVTCLYAREVMGVSDIVFHTFDEGKGKTWEGKCTPLIGFEEWCDGHRANPIVKQVIDLERCKPEHPHPKML